VTLINCFFLGTVFLQLPLSDDSIVTLPAGAVAKYCNEYVCLYVCMSVRECIYGTTCIAWSLPIFMPVAVAQSSSCRVTKSQKEGEILGFSFPLTVHCIGRIAVWILPLRTSFA